ncbi:YfgG family protein [Izhakiella capsodis]|uniref:YfgG family protein n=1 Tax=Izhakiella capsodis TaxID=1367852 RepID=UPI000ABE7094|nr:YfgG family protein [Izhakiella capsodis]
MNSATTPLHRRQRRKSSLMIRIVLLISFFILIGRLIFVIPGAISHHQQKLQEASTPTIPNPVKINREG